MNFPFLPNLFRKPKHEPIRAIVATRQESLAAQRKRTSVMLQLAVYAATTPPSQRKREAEAAIARLRETERAGR